MPRSAKAAAPAPVAIPAPRFRKVSAAGLLLPQDATEWVAVHDPVAALTWSRAHLSCGRVPWARAKSEAAKLDLCGFNDWRLGSRLEWAHLIEDNRYGPAIDTDFFTVPDSWVWCWTGTECAPSGCAWLVYLGSGGSGRLYQGFDNFVRAVRAGQLSELGVSS